MNLCELQDEHVAWKERNFPNDASWSQLLGVAEEVGELCHAHLKSSQGIRGGEESHLAAKIDAIGDILIFLAGYCNMEGIDMQTALDVTWNKVRRRDWTKDKINGRSKEANDLHAS